MKVFNACLRISVRRAAALLLYFVIFLALSIFMTAFSKDQLTTDFSAVRPDFAVINRDEDSPYVNGLLEYLSRHAEKVELEDDKETLQDATFFHAADYILILPKGFSEGVSKGEVPTLQTVTVKDSASGYYCDRLTNQYLNLLSVYKQLLPNEDAGQTVDNVLNDLSKEASVQKQSFLTTGQIAENYKIYMRMFAYIGIVLVTLCVSTILIVFQRPDLRMRNLCSPMRSTSFNFQLSLYAGGICLAAWLVLNLAGFLIYGGSIQGTDIRLILLLLLNSFIFILVALSISMLASSFVRTLTTQNAVANFLSLGLCFLGGIFVPLELLGKGMLTVARFTPTYWYVTALNQISSLPSIQTETLMPIFQSMLLQLCFFAAFTSVALVIRKVQGQSEKSFGSIQTEMEE